MTLPSCPHDDDPQLCPACNRDRAPRPLLAAYPSDCPECGEVIMPGDPIGRRGRDLAWFHDECR